MKVKVYFFKPSGKWYMTEEIEWVEIGRKYELANQTLYNSIKVANMHHRVGMYAVCIDNPTDFPLMIEIGEEQ